MPKICPSCGSVDLLVYTETAYDLNSGEFYCHSKNTHDDNAKVRCRECDWDGELIAVLEQEG